MTSPSRASADRMPLNGWVVFASVLLMVAGVVNAINGFTALQHDSYYVSHIVYDNLTFWGWAFLIWGVLQFLAGVLAWTGRTSGRSLAVVLTSTAAVLWFFLIFAAPWAALVGIGLNLAVLFALTVGSAPEGF